MTRTDLPPAARQLRVVDVVEVRSEPEILATLDDDGTLDGLPFNTYWREIWLEHETEPRAVRTGDV